MSGARPPRLEIRRLGPDDAQLVHAAAELFDSPPLAEPTERFLRSPTHHLLAASGPGGRLTGFVTGVEVTHPDKGTEMFLYELSVAEASRRQGIARALVEALKELARERGCYGMFVGTEEDNTAAVRTYAASGAVAESRPLMLEWRLT